MVSQPHGPNSFANICLINCCGLKSKTLSDDCENFIEPFDLICITETKLSSLDSLEFDKFELYTKCRSGAKRSSGGVALLLKRNFSKFVTKLNNDDDFSFWFIVNDISDNNKTLYCIAYIPPESSS
jgi:exonuclease III